jgi:hypothetical protein
VAAAAVEVLAEPIHHLVVMAAEAAEAVLRLQMAFLAQQTQAAAAAQLFGVPALQQEQVALV